MADQRLIIDVQNDITNFKRGVEEMRDLTENYHNFAEKQNKISSQAEAKMINKNALEIKKIRKKALADLDQEYKKAAKKAKHNKKELAAIEKNYHRRRKKLSENAEKEINKSRENQIKQFQNKIEDRSLKSIRKIKRQTLKELKSQYKQELRMARGNAVEQEKIRSRHRKQRGRVRGAAQQEGQAGGRGGGMKGKMKGGMIGLGLLAGGAAVKLFKDSDKAAADFADTMTRVSTLLSDEQAKALPQAMEQLRGTSVQTGQSIKELGDALYFTISAVPALANNLEAAASLTDKTSKAAIGLNTDAKSLTLAVTGLGNALGMSLEDTKTQGFLLDTLAATMKQGVMSGEQLSGSIARNAPLMGVITENSKEAAIAIASMSAAMTGSGVSMEEAQTQIGALAKALLDTKTRTQLLELGLEGVDKQTGKVKNWNVLFSSVNKNMGEMEKVLTRVEAKKALLLLGKTGKDNQSVYENMSSSVIDNANLSGEMFGKMAKTSERAGEILKQTWNDAMISLGQSIQGGLGGGISDFKLKIAGAIGWFGDLFKSNKKQFQEAEAELQKYGQVGANITQLLTQVNEGMQQTGAMDQSAALTMFDTIKTRMEDINTVSPFIAGQINAIKIEIAKSKDETADFAVEMEKVKNLLEGVETLAKANTLSAAMEAQTQSADKLNDAMNDNISYLDTIEQKIKNIASFDVSEIIKTLLTGGISLTVTTDEETRQVYENMGGDLEKMNGELQGLFEKQKLYKNDAEKLREINAQARDIATEINRVEKNRAGIQEGMKQRVKEALALELQRSGVTEETVDKEMMYSLILADVTNGLEKSTQYQKELKKMIADQLGPAKKQAELTERMREIKAELSSEDDKLIQKGRESLGVLQVQNIAHKEIFNSVAQKLKLENEMGTALIAYNQQRVEQLQNIVNFRTAEGIAIEDSLQAELKKLKAEEASRQIATEKAQKEQAVKDLLISQGDLKALINERVKEGLEGDKQTTANRIEILKVLVQELETRIKILQTQTGLSLAETAELTNKQQAVQIAQTQIGQLETQLENRKQFGLNEKGITKESKKQANIYKDQNEKTNDLLDLRMAELELLKEQGAITDIEFQEQSLEIAGERLAIQIEILETMRAEGASQKDIISQQKKVLGMKTSMLRSAKKREKKAAEEIEKRPERRAKPVDMESLEKTRDEMKKIQDQRIAQENKMLNFAVDQYKHEKDLADKKKQAEKDTINAMFQFTKQMGDTIRGFIGKSREAITGMLLGFRKTGEVIADESDRIVQAGLEEEKVKKELAKKYYDTIVATEADKAELEIALEKTKMETMLDILANVQPGKAWNFLNEQMREFGLNVGDTRKTVGELINTYKLQIIGMESELKKGRVPKSEKAAHEARIKFMQDNLIELKKMAEEEGGTKKKAIEFFAKNHKELMENVFVKINKEAEKEINVMTNQMGKNLKENEKRHGIIAYANEQQRSLQVEVSKTVDHVRGLGKQYKEETDSTKKANLIQKAVVAKNRTDTLKAENRHNKQKAGRNAKDIDLSKRQNAILDSEISVLGTIYGKTKTAQKEYDTAVNKMPDTNKKLDLYNSMMFQLYGEQAKTMGEVIAQDKALLEEKKQYISETIQQEKMKGDIELRGALLDIEELVKVLGMTGEEAQKIADLQLQLFDTENVAEFNELSQESQQAIKDLLIPLKKSGKSLDDMVFKWKNVVSLLWDANKQEWDRGKLTDKDVKDLETIKNLLLPQTEQRLRSLELMKGMSAEMSQLVMNQKLLNQLSTELAGIQSTISANYNVEQGDALDQLNEKQKEQNGALKTQEDILNNNIINAKLALEEFEKGTKEHKEATKALQDSEDKLYEINKDEGTREKLIKAQGNERKKLAKSIIDEGFAVDEILDKEKGVATQLQAIGVSFKEGEFAKGIEGLAKTFDTVQQSIEGGMDKIQKTVSAVTSGKKREIAQSVADLTFAAGKILMKAPFPLDIVGAVLFASGLYAKIALGLIDKIKGKEETATDIAEERREKEEQIRKEYDNQLERLQDMKEFGDKRVKTVKKELAYLQRIHKQLVETSKLARDMAKMSEDQLIAKKLELQTEIDHTEALLAKGRGLMESGRKQRKAFLEAQGIDVGLRDTKDLLAAWIADFDATMINLETEMTGVVGEMDFRKMFDDLSEQIKQDAKDVLKMRLDFVLEIDADPALIAESMKAVLKDVEGELGAEYGFKGLAIKSIEELEQILYEGYKTWSKPQLELFEQYFGYRKQEVDISKGLVKNIRDEYKAQFDLFEYRKKELEKQLHLGEITNKVFGKGMRDILTDQLALEEDILDQMVAGTAPLEQQQQQMETIWDLKKDIYDFDLAAADFNRSQIEHEKTRLGHLKDIGELTEEQYKDQLLAYLQDQLNMEELILQGLVDQQSNALDIFDQREQTWDIEKQIYDLMNAENDVQDEQLNKIRELNRERTKMIFQRGAGVDVDEQQIRNLENQIIQQMTAAGATQDQIDAQMQTFRATFQQFEGGTKGTRTKEGLSYLHDDEAVLNEGATSYLDTMFPGLIDSLNTYQGDEALNSIADTLARSKAELEVAKTINMINNNQVDLGGVIVYTQTNARPEDIAAAVDQQIERKFQGQGIQLTQL